MAEFKVYSAVEIIQLLGAQFREYRLRLNMTQRMYRSVREYQF